MGDQVSIFKDRSDTPDSYAFQTIYESQLVELAEVRSPAADQEKLQTIATQLRNEIAPVYVVYPWRQVVLETVPEAEFFELKTNRNQLLITREEQHKLYDTTVSIAGMSVGSSLLYGLVGSGFGRRFAIADDDTFSTSNLNRVPATVLDVGESKVMIAKRRALEMNPFLEIVSFNQRITDQDVDAFFMQGESRIVFEEIDDFRMKVILRERAKQAQIPLVMLTNLVDSVLVDVERYDTQPDTALFNGFVDDKLQERIKNSDITTEVMKELAVKLVDPSLVSDRAIQSLQQIGESLVGRPQLYSTVALDGGVAPYLFKKVVLGDTVSSGRYTLQLESSIKQ